MSYETDEQPIDSICEYEEFDFIDIKYIRPVKKGNGQNIIIKTQTDENIIIKTPNVKIEKLLKNRIGDCYMDLNISSDINKKQSKLFLKFIANIEDHNEVNIYNKSTEWFNNRQISYDTLDEYRKSSYSISSQGDIIFRVKYDKNEYKHLKIGDVVNLQLHIESIRFMKTRFYTEWIILQLNKIELTDFNFCDDNLIMKEYDDLFKTPSKISENLDKLKNQKQLEQQELEQRKLEQQEQRKLEQQEQRKLEQQELEQQKLEQQELEQQEQQKLEQQKLEQQEQQKLEQQKLEQQEQRKLEQQELDQQELDDYYDNHLEQLELDDYHNVTKLNKNYFTKKKLIKKKSKKKLIYGDKIKIWEN